MKDLKERHCYFCGAENRSGPCSPDPVVLPISHLNVMRARSVGGTVLYPREKPLT